ncbi:hypothetical protein EDD22DRAFT_777037 [Suillus occidentalis]|nr:hypothetical protein EDD22DRAFT_787514 [Suillus occidentalis]KAG1763498.1 hypothetical protein EDD22DRAFT_777037 [Suillus occidentalis]
MDGVKEGRIRITASKLPSFIYDEAMYDGTRKSMGCLRGYYLKRVFRHIFTGPSSALSPNGRKGTKTPKGRIHGMTTPTPHAIAYAAVQAYFQLSSATQWCKIIDEFDLVELYDRILTMFKDDGAGASWIKETIEHWKV